MNGKRINIAIVGTGVAGITAAQVLHKAHSVTLFERNDYVGGHTNTIVIDRGPDQGTPVDTGFIVFNDRTYPTFHRLLKRLGVAYRKSEMSWSYFDEASRLYYSGTSLNGLLARRANIINPVFISMVRGILRFHREAKRDLIEGQLAGVTLSDYLTQRGYPKSFINHYLLPMGAAIWSSATRDIAGIPADMFIRFFENHGLLQLSDRPQWYTVEGGSQSYVRAFLKQFEGRVELKARIKGVQRTDDDVTLAFENGSSLVFDKVIIAAHADKVLMLLDDPAPEETACFSPWRYSSNHCVLHTDDAVMPPNRRAWSSWNYVRENSGDGENVVSLNYYMNRLQGLSTRHNYFVSLNRNRPLPQERLIRELTYRHPTFTTESVATQPEISRLNGRRNTFFCGSYLGYGFHEDAVKAGAAVGRHFGMEL